MLKGVAIAYDDEFDSIVEVAENWPKAFAILESEDGWQVFDSPQAMQIWLDHIKG